MEYCKSVPTLMFTISHLSTHGGTNFPDPQLYKSVVGFLQYVCIERPDLSYSVNKVCQFMQTLKEVHWSAVKRIIRYLKGTITPGLFLRKSTS